jgi:hypothetical protein
VREIEEDLATHGIAKAAGKGALEGASDWPEADRGYAWLGALPERQFRRDCFMDAAGPALGPQSLGGEIVVILLQFGFLFFHPSFGRLDLAVVALISFAPRFGRDVEIPWCLVESHRYRFTDGTVCPGGDDDHAMSWVII